MELVMEIRESHLNFVYGERNRYGIIKIKDNFSVPFLEEYASTHGRDLSPIEISAINEKIRAELKNRNIKEKKINLIINNRTGLTKQMEIPKVNRKKTLKLVRNELILELNINRNFIADYMVLDPSKENPDMRRVLALAVKTSQLEEIEIWMNDLGFRIKSIESGSTSMLSILEDLNCVSTEEPMIVVDLTRDYTRLFLFNEQRFLVLRSVYPSEKHIDQVGRIANLINLMSTSLYRKDGVTVEKVMLVGDELEIERLIKDIESSLDYDFVKFDPSSKIVGAELNIISYVNCLGGIK